MALPGRAELASLRLLAVGAAVTALVIAGAGLAVSRLRGVPLDAGALAWSVASLGVIVLAGCAAYLLPARPLRGLAGLGALLHLVGLGVGLAGAAGSPGTPSIQQWIPTASAAAVLAALVAGGLWVSWGLLAASAALTVSTQALNGSLAAHAWANDLQAVLAGVVLGFIGTVTLELSRKIDANAREAREAARVAAHRRAEFSALTRAGALVHDEVLATLAFAASPAPPPRERLARQARRALTLISELAAGDARAPGGLAHALAAGARELAPDATVTVDSASAADTTVAPHVAEAARAAMGQAISNARRHAGPGARLRVEVHERPGALRITVADDGRGFDTQRIAADRLGLRTSIVQRMREVGGTAEITSAPGRGTRVEISWRDAPAPVLAQPRTELLQTLAFAVVALTFVLTQVALAVMATSSARLWWSPLVALALLFAACELLRLGPPGRPGTGRTAATVALTVAATTVGAIGAPPSYSDQWFAVAAAFVLTTLAFRDRWWIAAAGGTVVAAIVACAGVLDGAVPIATALVVARVLLITALATAFAIACAALQRRALSLHARAVQETEEAAWLTAARTELAARSAELRETVGPALAALASLATASELTAHDRRACLALEGRLRDGIRAGRLDQQPLRDAADAARGRGVDVLLLDDRADAQGPDGLPEMLHLVATHLRESRTQAVVRLLPAGRAIPLSLVIDGTPVDLTGPVAALPRA